jgi:uncharacterized protein YfaP (DUF2135 family)
MIMKNDLGKSVLLGTLLLAQSAFCGGQQIPVNNLKADLSDLSQVPALTLGDTVSGTFTAEHEESCFSISMEEGVNYQLHLPEYPESAMISFWVPTGDSTVEYSTRYSSIGRYAEYTARATDQFYGCVSSWTEIGDYSVYAAANENPTAVNFEQNHREGNISANTVLGSFSAEDPDENAAFTYILDEASSSNNNDLVSISGNELLINDDTYIGSDTEFAIDVFVKDNHGATYLEQITFTVESLWARITRPNFLTQLHWGDSIEIQWHSSFSFAETANITIASHEGDTITNTDVSNNGQYLWFVPENAAPNTFYNVNISDGPQTLYSESFVILPLFTNPLAVEVSWLNDQIENSYMMEVELEVTTPSGDTCNSSNESCGIDGMMLTAVDQQLGPRTFTLDTPEDGDYIITAHYNYNDTGFSSQELRAGITLGMEYYELNFTATDSAGSWIVDTVHFGNYAPEFIGFTQTHERFAIRAGDTIGFVDVTDRDEEFVLLELDEPTEENSNDLFELQDNYVVALEDIPINAGSENEFTLSFSATDPNIARTFQSYTFTVEPAQIHTPVAGEIFSAGEEITITWDAEFSSADEVLISLWNDNSRALMLTVENSGSASITLPDSISGYSSIDISGNNENLYGDQFVITPDFSEGLFVVVEWDAGDYDYPVDVDIEVVTPDETVVDEYDPMWTETSGIIQHDEEGSGAIIFYADAEETGTYEVSAFVSSMDEVWAETEVTITVYNNGESTTYTRVMNEESEAWTLDPIILETTDILSHSAALNQFRITNNQVHYTLTNSAEAVFQLFDINGREVFRKTLTAQSGQFSLTDLHGFYTGVISQGNQKSVQSLNFQ